MRYLRMFTNAVAGGVLMATYIAVLVFQVNPQVPAVSMTALGWIGAVVSFYAPYLSVALYFLILVRDLVASRPLRPAWLSVRMLAWLGTVSTAAMSALTWANLSAFAPALSEIAVERMRAGAWATTVMAVVLGVTAILRYSFERRGTRAVGVMLVVSLVLSFVAPMWLRGPGEAAVRLPRRPGSDGRTHPRVQLARVPFAPRVHIFALDGASLGFIRQRVGAGELPNFARILDRGATTDLSTFKPTQAEPVWAAAATGKSSQQNGVRSSAAYRIADTDSDAADVLPDYCFAYALPEQGFVRTSTPTAASLTARPLWDILADYGVTSGVAGWPLTFPAHADLGYVLSNRFDEASGSPLRLADAAAGDPTTAVDVAREIFDRWQATPWREILPALPAGTVEPVGLNSARWDQAYHDTAAELDHQFAPKLTAVFYEGLDTFGHYYLHDAQPELFGDPRRADPARSILDQYYAYLDEEIGVALRGLGKGDLLIVVSGFGMEPTPWTKRLLARVLGSPDFVGTHEPAPDGFLLAYGDNVAAGQYARGSVVDLAPTVLYYMGVDVGKDMDGFARTDLFASTYVLDHPVRYVASHER